MAFYDELNNPSNFVTRSRDNPRNAFGVFAKGYLDAASDLAEMLLSSPHFSDYSAYPVVFLYRHSFELFLKNAIYKSVQLSSLRGMSDLDSGLYNNHKLIVLAEKVAELIRMLFPDDVGLEGLSEEILRISSEFSEIDPDSFAYRYPIDTKGNPSTRSGQRINLEAFHRNMSELLHELKVVDFGLDVDTSKAEQIHEILEDLRTTDFSG